MAVDVVAVVAARDAAASKAGQSQKIMIPKAGYMSSSHFIVQVR